MVHSNKKQPNVSVVIPTYRRAHLIGKAIESILNQTYQDFEIIVVNDEPDNKTQAVVQSFNDHRIRFIQHETNKGAPTARNTGIKAARGNFIAFQDSDDEWLPKKLEKQIKSFAKTSEKVGVVYTGFLRVEDGKEEYVPYKWVTRKDGDIQKELLKGNFITTPAMVVRKECLAKAGLFDPSLPRLQDWELAIRLSKFYHFKCIDEPLLIQPFTPGSITADKRARIEALKIILSKHLEVFYQEKKILSNYYYGIAEFSCLNSSVAEGDKYFAKALEINPDKKKMSEQYFIAGRRMCTDNNFKEGRRYLLKAAKANPLSMKITLVTLLSYLNRSLYRRFAEFYRKRTE